MKKNGFTLVELLVAISILAILTAIAIPTLRAFQNNNSTKQYETYRESLQTSGKLYNDSYSDDIFQNTPYGCEKVPLTEMMYKKIAKDIELKDVTCNISSKDSFVVVRKFYFIPKMGYSYIGTPSIWPQWASYEVVFQVTPQKQTFWQNTLHLYALYSHCYFRLSVCTLHTK